MPINTDIDFGGIAFGNPFPSTWQPFIVAHQDVIRSYAVAGTNDRADFLGEVYVATTTLPTAAAPITPIVGPVSNPAMNGTNFFFDQSGVGTTPTVTWDAPAVGTATHYRVRIDRLYVGAQGHAASELAGFFYLTGTSLTIPPNLLVPGNNYVFTIFAESLPGIDITQTPFRLSFPHGFASSLSGLITP